MVTTTARGTTEFTLFAPHAHTVELLGTFTRWNAAPIAMTRRDEGWWTVDLSLLPGDHEFLYRLDGGEWRPDYAAHGVRLNELGAWVSGLHIAPTAPATTPAPTVRTRSAADLAHAA